MSYKVIVVGCSEPEAFIQNLGDQFDVTAVADATQAMGLSDVKDFKLVLVSDLGISTEQALARVRDFKEIPDLSDIPVVVLAEHEHSLELRMAFYDAGCEDYIQHDSDSELQMRLMRVIFNRIANQQLQQQLEKANEMAFIAMSDTSDLGVNIQFLLDINHCENLDQAGMRLFQALKSYNINCSLQIRSRYGVKNMEANGMAKDLESTLMQECKDRGRYVDFGHRSIMNYGCVSLLVRNMPVDDDKKYGAIKDNVFSLLQGLDARVRALDNAESLKLESTLVVRLAAQMSELMENVDQSYHDVMVRIADAVEDIADGVDREIQFLGMDEQQERTLQKLMEDGILETNRIFNEGLKVDKNLSSYLDLVGKVFSGDRVNAQELQDLLDQLPAVGGVA